MVEQDYWNQQNPGYGERIAQSPQYQPTQQYQQTQQQYYQQGYQQPAQQMQQVQPYYQPNNPVVTTGEWVVNLLLVSIPIVGLVMLFVWAFGETTPESKRNWARANLIWILIGIAVVVIISVLFTFTGISLATLSQASYR